MILNLIIIVLCFFRFVRVKGSAAWGMELMEEEDEYGDKVCVVCFERKRKAKLYFLERNDVDIVFICVWLLW